MLAEIAHPDPIVDGSRPITPSLSDDVSRTSFFIFFGYPVVYSELKRREATDGESLRAARKSIATRRGEQLGKIIQLLLV